MREKARVWPGGCGSHAGDRTVLYAYLEGMGMGRLRIGGGICKYPCIIKMFQ